MGSRKVIYGIVIFLLVISIIHFPVVVGEENKHKVITEEEFQDKLENNDYDFSWCVFEFHLDFSDRKFLCIQFNNSVFKNHVNFSHCNLTHIEFKNTIFEGNVTFSYCNLLEVDFGNAIFNNNVSFYNSQISNGDFINTTFQGEIRFYESNPENIDFRNALFNKHINFIDVTFTKANFKDTIFKEKVTFYNTIFKDDTDFSNATFEKDVLFEKIRFDTTGDNYTNFEEVTFKEEVEFIGISFEKGVKFDNAIFEGNNNNFYDVNATGYVHFNNVTFKKHVGFHKFRFDEGIDFKGSIFESDAGFGTTRTTNIIKKSAIFENVTFGGNTTFMNVNFESAQFNSIESNETLSKSTIFKGYAYFEQGVTFGGADFNDITFEDKVLFLIVTFQKDVTFKKGGLDKGTIFKGETSFSGVKFEESVYFDDAVFEDIVWFQSHGTNENTTFGKEKYLNDRKRTASFIGTEFHDTVGFDCTFNVNATFQSAKFKGDTYFVGTIFEDELDLKSARFEQEFKFMPQKIEKLNLKNITTYGYTKVEHFESVMNLADTQIVLNDLTKFKSFGYTEITGDSTNATFNDAYLENVNFVKCEWPDPFIIYEEKEEEKKENPNYEDLEIIYRNLKNSFTKYGDNDHAGAAFYREMEMKKLRVEEEGKCLLKCWYWFLKWSCGYGEKPLRIIGWDIGIIFLFAGLFYKSRINVEDHPYLYFRDKVEYTKFCLLFSIASFTTLGSRYMRPKGKWARRGSTIESLIGAFFIALFIYVFARKMLR